MSSSVRCSLLTANAMLRQLRRIAPGMSAIAIVVLALAVAKPLRAESFACAAGDVPCLISAINQANANGHPTNTIRLAPGTYTLTNIDNDTAGPNGLPSITSTLTIDVTEKEMATIMRASNAVNFRLFHVGTNGRLILRGVTLSGGVSGFALANNGGGLYNNGGAVTIIDSVVHGNQSVSGGGLYNNGGAVTIIDSVVLGNRSDFGSGGGIYNQGGWLTIARSTFDRNIGFSGAAVFTINNGSVSVSQSRFTSNGGGGTGGGVMAWDGTLFIAQSTFGGNSSESGGAGIFVLSGTAVVRDSAFVENHSFSGSAIHNSGTVDAVNTTFARNVLQPFFNGQGLAIRNRGRLSLTNSTLAENNTLIPPIGPARMVLWTDGTTILQNTILVHDPNAPFIRDCGGGGAVISLGNNLIGDPSGCDIVLQPSDLTGDAGLGPFTDNGTPGNGHFPLLSTSRAIDAGNGAACPPTDQLGQPRVGHCDIGAIEFHPPVLTVTIEIKPGSDPAPINPKSAGVIPVAILTTQTFNAATVDASTVRFGKTGTEATAVRSALQDVDENGTLDMILHFQTQGAGITCGDTSAFLNGQTISKLAIQGSDAIVTVGCH